VAELRQMVQSFSAGSGPVAVDAERASGYRYGQRAYLVQLRRQGAGTALIDPLPFSGSGALEELDSVLADAEWVVHAASQDLPCLAEIGLRPRRLFDTELAGRLAGFERVGLGAIIEHTLGYSLEKGHSAADWSTRPLPEAWLTYAALDVELLVELRDALAIELDRQGKLSWAEQEFAALVTGGPAKPRQDPWRRTSGIHKIRAARGLARVQALWEARDELARSRDIAPGRVLPDSAIIAAAQQDPATAEALTALPVFSGRANRQLVSRWWRALDQARKLAEDELPAASLAGEGPPPAHRWADRDPVAARRLAVARQVLSEVAERVSMPMENLLAPDLVRRLAWSPPDPLSNTSVARALASSGARPWQVELTAEVLAEALAELA
jgi:ribonuclease D